MSAPATVFLRRLQSASQLATMLIVALFAAGLSVATALAATGMIPWAELPLLWEGQPVAWAGMAAQIGLTILTLTLCAFLPSNVRVMRLEAAHRDFAVGMEDVARAYWTAHRADRTGVFAMRREFDAIRERYQFLRTHPDLRDLDPQIIELASQMSHESAELAAMYSDEKVARAREMLDRRREEVERMSDRIAVANSATREMKRLLEDVDTDERIIRSQLSRLRAEIGDLFAAVESGNEAATGAGRDRRAVLRVAQPAE